MKEGKCKNKHCSVMSVQARTDLNNDCTVLKLHDLCGKKGYISQKQLTIHARRWIN